MIYNTPIYENNLQYVPVVVKNKDELIGFLRGVNSYLGIVTEVLESIGLEDPHIEVDKAEFLDLTSQNFNDVLEDGRRVSQLTKSEKSKYGDKIFNDAINFIESCVTDNIKSSNVLSVSCQCNFGHYSWEKYEHLPTETFKCVECERVLIHYTGHNHYEYEYDEGDKNAD